jgi:anaerobic magnesium-protoporphyrin IX monomethyl ester cyclase
MVSHSGSVMGARGDGAGPGGGARAGGAEILLVFPGRFKAPDPQVPLQLLHVASALQQAGYRPRIADLRLHDYRSLDIGDPLFVGLTCMSGPQIRYGLEFARRVRAERPGLPLVWGGVHPTLLPEQAAAHDCVDVVVRGESELIVAALADSLAAGRLLGGDRRQSSGGGKDEPFDGLKGVTYADDGAIVSTPDAQLIDLDAIPVELPYGLLHLDKYATLQAGRVHMQTSRGCPHRCGFCYNTDFNGRRWRGKSPERVVDEMEALLRRFPHVKIIDPVDDNFFVDRKRAESICNEILRRGVKVAWRANCRFDYLATYDRDFVSLIERAGCMELDFGGESGSVAMQDFVCKEVSAEEMLTSVAHLHEWAPSIDPFVSWLSGLPGETYDDMTKTFDLMDAMGRANPRTQHYGIFLYTPFPSPLLASLPPEFVPPQSLDEWGEIEVFHFEPPWHTRAYVEKLRTISAVTRYAFYPESRLDEHGPAFRAGYRLMNRAARYRWEHRYFEFPFELRLANEAARRMRGFL